LNVYCYIAAAQHAGCLREAAWKGLHLFSRSRVSNYRLFTTSPRGCATVIAVSSESTPASESQPSSHCRPMIATWTICGQPCARSNAWLIWIVIVIWYTYERSEHRQARFPLFRFDICCAWISIAQVSGHTERGKTVCTRFS